ncbi:Arrestin-like protein [Ooceraea biroi]|uniref:Phosrestin-1 n=1 Tax=Ooceraea biroi TaxID=2015173 RepID=A0A026WU24_OOCBI|nr:Arrestin-like protein [Ooceraea biroi]
MFPILFLAYVVAVKVFKKTTPNGKVTVYLSKRDFIDHLDHVDPIDGVIVVENDYLQGRKVFGQVLTTYRYGREEDEVMGVKFSKELVICRDQIVPSKKEKQDTTSIQERLLKRLDPNAFPFIFHFPQNAPSSVTLQPGDDDQGKPLGVDYTVKIFVGDNEEDKGHKRSSVSLAIKKLQYAPLTRGRRLPSSLVSKGFTFSQGKLNLEVTLDKEIYYHGEKVAASSVSLAIKKLQYAPLTRGRRLPSSLVSKGFTFSQGKLNLEVTLDKEIYYHGEKVAANVTVTNNSRKAVKNIKMYVVQHCEVTMVNAQFSRHVASLETREGCPITPGASFTKQFYLVPLASSNKDRRGIALDGHLKDDDVNLASSTMAAEGKCPTENLGIVISYSVRVKLNCGTLGGELVTDVPFKLMHPAPGAVEREKAMLKKGKSIDRARYESFCYANDDDDNIVFEDFARLRLNEPE